MEDKLEFIPCAYYACFSTELDFTQEDPVYQDGLCWECEVDVQVSVISYTICCDHQWDILIQILVANNNMRQRSIWIKESALLQKSSWSEGGSPIPVDGML